MGILNENSGGWDILSSQPVHSVSFCRLCATEDSMNGVGWCAQTRNRYLDMSRVCLRLNVFGPNTENGDTSTSAFEGN